MINYLIKNIITNKLFLPNNNIIFIYNELILVLMAVTHKIQNREYQSWVVGTAFENPSDF